MRPQQRYTLFPYTTLFRSTKDRFFGKGAEIGFVLDDNYWNQGIVTEAVYLVMKYVFRTLSYDYLKVAHADFNRSEEHTSELQSRPHLVCRLLLEKKKKKLK